MNDFYMNAIVVFAIIVLTGGLMYSKNKGIVGKGKLISDDIIDAIYVVRLITEAIPIKDGYKNKATAIYDIADIVTEYIHILERQPEKRDEVAIDAVLKLLTEIDVVPTEAEIKLIKVAIEHSFKWLDKNVPSN